MEDSGAARTSNETARVGFGTGPNRDQCEATGMATGRLLELTHHEEKLLDRIRQLNYQGVLQLQAGGHVQALHFFQQCESTLQYAAGCGKTLDRSLILTVLNNEAVAYQRSQEHERASSYVEAIIYNLNLFLESQQNRLLLTRLTDRMNRFEKGERDLLSKAQMESINAYALRKYDLAVYLLQFSGLQSQCMAHEDSLSNARKALLAVRELCEYNLQLLALKNEGDTINIALLQELNQLPLMIDRNDYQSLRKEFDKVVKSQQGSSQTMGSDLSQEASLLLSRTNFEEIFTLRAKQVHQSLLETSSTLKHHPFSSQHHLQKVILVVCAYFTMGAELEELSEEGHCSSIYLLGPSQQSHEGECYHLMALIIGSKYLPANNKFLQELLSIYRQTYHHSPVPQQSISHHLDQLTQKYKNYLMERDISISLDDSQQKQVDPQAEARWNEEKKESKKLNELLKQDPISRGGQESYFMEVPSIDSIEMANSLSNRNKTDNSADQLPPKRNKINLHPKLKGSRVSIDYNQDSKLPGPAPLCQIPIIQCSREDDRAESRKGKGNNNNSSKKSKSKKGKSRGKLIETKKIQKCTTMTSIPMLGLMTTITERSSKKLKPKRSPQRDQRVMIGSAGVDHNRWAGDSKKIISSQQIKPPKINQFSSVKNIEPIRLNKVKGPTKICASSGVHQMKSLQAFRLDKGSSQRSGKGKSKGKSSASFKSKKSSSNSSSKTPLKKNLTKTVTTARDKIYTSIKQTVRRR